MQWISYDTLSSFGLILILIVLFVILSSCVEFGLCPNLSMITNYLNLSESVAGMTLTAFANGCGDIASTWSAFDNNQASLALGELTGASTFISLFIVGMISILKPSKQLHQNLVRDCLVFAIANSALLFIGWTETVNIWISCLMLLFYASYLGLLLHFKPQEPISPNPLLISVESPVNVPHIPSELSLGDNNDYFFPQITRRPSSLFFRSPIDHIVDTDEEEALSFAHTEPHLPVLGVFSRWHHLKPSERVYLVLNAIPTIIMSLLFPIVIVRNDDYQSVDQEEHLIYDLPPFSILFFKLELLSVSLLLTGGLLFSYPLYLVKKRLDQQQFAIILSVIGFFGSLFVTGIVSNELIGAFTSLVKRFGLNPTVTGFTLFAIGNSLPDLITNLSLARMGLTEMALGACYGNLILGVGLSGFVKAIQDKPVQLTNLGLEFYLSCGCIYLIVMLTLLNGYCNKWTFGRPFGILCVCLYILIVIGMSVLPKTVQERI
ncbi:Sodium/calcium exchanger protein-domain-containing protein [Gorgonomyces haynaldii]|nr:Sodium/calcium exchanger protein-domain-containing protein [Gorgonomyces haynaldii]